MYLFIKGSESEGKSIADFVLIIATCVVVELNLNHFNVQNSHLILSDTHYYTLIP